MTFQPVPAASIAAMLITELLSFGLPIALFIILRVKAKARILPFFLGCISFTLFAMVLEQRLHAFVLGGPMASAITGNIWLYALYGGAAAGLFEETGRYLFMLLVMKKDHEPQNALMYGAGHGGIEAILIVGMTYINSLIYAFMINSGSGDKIIASLSGLDEATGAAAAQSIASLSSTAPYLFLVAGFERVLAISLHIALSVLIYTAIRKKKFGYALLAFALHMLVDSVTLIINAYASIIAVELAVLVMTALIALYALKLCRQAKEELAQSESVPPEPAEA